MNIPTLDTLPSLPLNSLKRLPECHAIYFARSADGSMLYIGKASNLRQRWAAHHRTSQLATYPGVSIAWLEVSDRGLLDEIEQACIAHFSPALNDTEVIRTSGRIARTIYLPPELKDRITKAAEADDRSENSLIVKAIMAYLDSCPAAPGPTPKSKPASGAITFPDGDE